MSGKFQLNWIKPPRQAKQERLPSRDEVMSALKPGAKVEITAGFLKGERAAIEVNEQEGSHIQDIEPGWTEVWIRYEKDGEHVGKALLTPRWYDISELRIVE
jgi:hypothetical protein